MTLFWIILFWSAAFLVVYVQLGYVLVLRVLPRRRVRAESVDRDQAPRVALVIPAHNEEEVIADKIRNARALEYPAERLEIVVACDGCTDDTVRLARQFEGPGCRVLDFDVRRGKASVVSDAVAQSEADLVCLCDANVMFQPDALGRLVACLADPSVGAATGDVRLASDHCNFGQGEKAYYKIERIIQEWESRTGSAIGVDGGMYVIRRELFRPLLPDTILDDFVISMNVLSQGRRVVYESSAVANEGATPTAREEFRRRVRIAAGAMQVLKRRQWPPLRYPVTFWQFVSHKLLRWTGPIWLLALLVSNIALWSEGPVYRVLLGAQLSMYALAVLAAIWMPLRRSRPGGILFYFVMSHVAMAIGMTKGVFNGQSVTWSHARRSAKQRTLQTANMSSE